MDTTGHALTATAICVKWLKQSAPATGVSSHNGTNQRVYTRLPRHGTHGLIAIGGHLVTREHTPSQTLHYSPSCSRPKSKTRQGAGEQRSHTKEVICFKAIFINSHQEKRRVQEQGTQKTTQPEKAYGWEHLIPNVSFFPHPFSSTGPPLAMGLGVSPQHHLMPVTLALLGQDISLNPHP